ncbi:hypothetical protein DAE35_19295 [Salmonella enterica]|nr:hypothetical protein CHD23_08660 [Salmonella enterica]EAW1150263.1 hypothetical protein [Salmonella enterica subsp. houtenae]EBI0041917.1 hypothetical protein [Salmonella enterica subsp. diarizonae serovar 61:k:z35]EDU0973403.1 helix-turn-helix domain-containing protein [Salmonella enterica subsp. arizonae serovar 38:z4,z23:-]EIW3436604.1 helix-turn-helix domain-containing protein [Salmonella enterica subsp. houtenae serovar 38:z4,z23:-]
MSGLLAPEQCPQAGRLIGAGVPRQQVAIIYDAGVSTLYRKFPPSNMPLMSFIEKITLLQSAIRVNYINLNGLVN